MYVGCFYYLGNDSGGRLKQEVRCDKIIDFIRILCTVNYLLKKVYTLVNKHTI